MSKSPSRRQARDRAILTRLVDELGVSVIIRYNEHPRRIPGSLIILRKAIEQEIRDRYGNDTPLPFWSHHGMGRESRVAVLHPIAEPHDRQTGLLGSGKAAFQVHKVLRNCGIDQSYVADIATCFKNIGDRLPTIKEMEADRKLMFAALDAADVNFVLLHGWHATHEWRSDVNILQVSGQVGLWQQRWWVTPIYHADSVHRPHGMQTREDWQRAIDRFVDVVSAPSPFQLLGSRCIHKQSQTLCGAMMYAMDEDGLPWCQEHWDQGRQGHIDSLHRTRSKHPINPDQLTLEV